MSQREVFGLAQSGKAYFVLERLPREGTFLAVVGEDDAQAFYDNLRALGMFFEGPSVHLFISSNRFERINTLRRLSEDPRGIIVTTPESLAEKTNAPRDLSSKLVEFAVGKAYRFNDLIDKLMTLGYQRVDFVEEKGSFSRRGEVLDIWASDQNTPWRLVFGDDTLESIRSFDIVTQRSLEFLMKAVLLPAVEAAQGYLTEYLPAATLAYLDAPLEPEDPIAPIINNYEQFINTPLAHGTGALDAGFRAHVRWAGNYPAFIKDVRQLAVQNFLTVIFCGNEGEKERLEEIFAEQRWHDALPEMTIAPLSEGFVCARLKMAVISAQEVFYKRRPLSFPKFKTGRRLEGLWEISGGDYVVHEKYGIGRYLGLKKISRGDHEAEYLCVEYKGGDKLYVPTDDFKVVQKYVGVEGQRPRLFSLDTVAWERLKQRAKEGAKEMAQELLRLYAERQNTPGQSYPQDTVWEKELADSFAYTETEDQRKAIEEVRSDLEAARPMERVVCGDVGFGKTEVAIRAAFKVAVAGRQVAVLVPTTVLAEQHFTTFSNRLAPFPVKVAMLSRFQTKAEQKKVVAEIAKGAVEIVVGTHRLIQKDIAFKDLGLLVIDEEHRFGVKQKEKIKSLKKNVDVLLLSATPIPRTLSLALASLRDLSVIETPPYGRLPIETHLGPYDEKTVKKIIQAELSRGGQVFYVHNRVETIFSRAEYLKRLIPDIRWAVVHGQLPAGVIEKNMWKFMHREIDVLIATTIIESGLDIPTVNTMIIEEAENFGLAQLYQLRGRIGREKQKAYCYLFYTASKLSDDAMRRLEALQEFGELGSGFRLALRDLEIRGAGNILGAEQHGFVRDIGFELYSRLLEEESRKLKGIAVEEEKERRVTVDMLTKAFIPGEYIEAEDVRIVFYRRLADAKTEEDIAKIKDELIDRFGRLPRAVENLIAVTHLKLRAEQTGVIRSIIESENCVEVYFAASAGIPPQNIVAFAHDYEGILEFMRGEAAAVRLNKTAITGDLPAFLGVFLEKLKRYLH